MLYKNELNGIPPISCDLALKGKNQNLTTAVQFVGLPKSGRVLAVDIYYDTKKELVLRFFSDGISFTACTRWPATEWTTGIIKILENYWGYYYSYYHDAENKGDPTAKEVNKFLGARSTYPDDDVIRSIMGFAQDVGREKRMTAEDHKQELQHEHFSMYPELPLDLADYCETKIFKYTYFFVTGLKNSRRDAVCGRCGREFTAGKSDKSNHKGVCPGCGAEGRFKGDWTAVPLNKAKICVAHKVDGQLLLRWMNVERSFPGKRSKYDFDDYYYNLYLNTKRGQVIYSYKYMPVMYYGWEWIRKRNGDVAFEDSYIYTNNLHEVFGEKYYNVDLEAGLRDTEEICFSSLLLHLKKIPAAEYLFKLGLPILAASIREEDIEGGGGFSGTLGVSRQYLPLYRKYNFDVFEHNVIKASRTWVSEELYRKFRELKPLYYEFRDIKELLQEMSFERFVNYFTRQKEVVGGMRDVPRFPSGRRPGKVSLGELMTLYRDYINMSKKFKVDLSHKSIRFPKDIKEAHDQIMEKINKIKKAAEKRKNTIALKKLRAFYEELGAFTKNGFTIVYPINEQDFITEGQSLHHCVGSYFGRHLKGDRMIFFIRLEDQPDKPYFTLEVDMKDYRICQLRGTHNCEPKPKVKTFASAFIKHIKEAADKKAKAQNSAGKERVA